MIKKIAFLAFAIFFLIANRGAYRGYFDGDDLDNLPMTSGVPAVEFVQIFASPELAVSNFRPVGHAFYKILGPVLQLDYPKYIFAIHGIHLLNVILLWLLLEALGFTGLNAAFGAMLFAFNMGVFEIYFKPMYVFDLLCASFCLASLLLWIKDYWILSLLAFWTAYRAKEVAIALPMVLLLINWQLGKERKNWWKLAPFFAVSLSFGIQALLANQGRDNAYSFRFTKDAFETCVKFYGQRVLIIPNGGVLILALAFLKNKWARVGVLSFIVLLAPLLFLPGRLFGAYLYVPLIGVSIAAAAFACQFQSIETNNRPVLVLLMLFWISFQFRELRERRNPFLESSEQNRRYVDTLRLFVQTSPATNKFAFLNWPDNLHHWGVRGAVRLLKPNDETLEFADFGSPESTALLAKPSSVLISWLDDTQSVKILSHAQNAEDASYIRMNLDTPIWQLGAGWRSPEPGQCWMKLESHTFLKRPAQPSELEVVVNAGPKLIDSVHLVKFEVWLDGQKLGEREFSQTGIFSLRYPAPSAKAGTRSEVVLKASPGYFEPGVAHDPDNAFGIAVTGLGFVPEKK